MKQKVMVYVIAIAICAVGFPFYYGFTHGPDHTIDKMFTYLMVNNFIDSHGKKAKEANDAIAPMCASKEAAEKIALSVGMMVMPIVGSDGYEYDILKTIKDGDSATVSVKLYSGEKSVVADFKLNKVKNGDPLESFFGRWVLHGVEKGK